jgi:hypothetical protein
MKTYMQFCGYLEHNGLIIYWSEKCTEEKL